MLGEHSRTVDLMERTVQRYGAVRVLVSPVVRFRALVSHLLCTMFGGNDNNTIQRPPARFDEETCQQHIRSATTAMDICDTRPLQAILFHEYYNGLLNDAVNVLLRQVPEADVVQDPVLKYIQVNPTAGQTGGEQQQVTDQGLGESLRQHISETVERRSENRRRNTILQQLQNHGIIVDPDDFTKQLQNITKTSFSPNLQRDQAILDSVVRFASMETPIATMVGMGSEDWKVVQRKIRNAVTLLDFNDVYDAVVGTIPTKFRIDPDQYQEWANGLNNQNDDAMMFLHHFRTIRLFYFELYRRCHHPSGMLRQEELLRKDTWVSNGLLICIQADRAYTLITRQENWMQGTTIHPIYIWYVEQFANLFINPPNLLAPTLRQ